MRVLRDEVIHRVFQAGSAKEASKGMAVLVGRWD